MAELVDALVSDASGNPMEVQVLLAAPNEKTMKNPYKTKSNSKIIALIVEIVLIVIGVIVLSILQGVGVPINYIPVIIITGILLFSLVLTLSLIRYDSIRENRKTFKEGNMPLYTDQTTLLGHDIKDEQEK